jgi:hypothetical protein
MLTRTVHLPGPSLKRKRSGGSDEEIEEPPQQLSDSDGEQTEREAHGDAEEDYSAPRKQAAAKRGRPKGRTAASKPRAPKTAVPKPSGSIRRARKPREGADALDPEVAAKEAKIATDNPLFSACARHCCRARLIRLRCYHESVRGTAVNRRGLPRLALE